MSGEYCLREYVDGDCGKRLYRGDRCVDQVACVSILARKRTRASQRVGIFMYYEWRVGQSIFACVRMLASTPNSSLRSSCTS